MHGWGVWLGAGVCMAGGVCGLGVRDWGHAWLVGECVARDMHGCGSMHG